MPENPPNSGRCRVPSVSEFKAQPRLCLPMPWGRTDVKGEAGARSSANTRVAAVEASSSVTGWAERQTCGP